MRWDRVIWYISMIGIFIFEVDYSKGQSLIERWHDPVNWVVAVVCVIWYLTGLLCDTHVFD